MKSTDLFFINARKTLPSLILITLFLLRISYTAFIITEQNRNARDILSIILLSIFIYFEKDNLDIFNIAGIDIKLFVLVNILFQIILFSDLYFIYLICGSFVLWVYIKWIRQQEKPVKRGWIIISVSLGIVLPIMFNWIDINILKESTNPYHSPGLLYGIFYFLHTLASTAIIEEYIFRAILWGICRKMNFREHTILLVQAFLFWIIHIRYIREASYTFWFVIPVQSLIFGFIVIKYRSITPTIIIHALYNTLILFLN